MTVKGVEKDTPTYKNCVNLKPLVTNIFTILVVSINFVVIVSADFRST